MFHAWLIIATICVFLFALASLYVLVIFIRRRRYTKERFAFAALTAIVTLTTVLITAIVGQSMPWYTLWAILGWATGKDFTVPTPSFADYALLVLVYLIAISVILSIFRQWHGLCSEHQYEIEQRREQMSLLTEGLKELSRILYRSEPPALHQPLDFKLNSQLRAPSNSIAWRDRARELLRLKWSCYAFPDDGAWHEKAECWVGRNVDTKDLVFLRCAGDNLNSSELQGFVDYANRIKADRREERIELILAVESKNATPINVWNGAPIQFETAETLLSELVDWTDYKNDIRKRMTVTQLPDSNLTVADVFVQPRFIPVGWEIDNPNDLEPFLDEWLKMPDQGQLALLGDYGQGKSTATLAFVHRLLEQENSDRIPVLIELRGTSPRNLTPLQLLGAWSSKYNINPKALLYLHMSGRLVLIFEGFDEMALVGDAEMRLKHFRTLWEFCYPSAKILITGRPNFFFDEKEMIASLGISEPIIGKPYCRPIRLLPFDIPQIHHALRNQDREVQQEICGFANANKQFLELISRPSLLHIVSILWKQESLSKQLDKLTSAYVIRLFVRHSYRRQGLKENESPEFMALTTEERQYFMRGIAAFMASKRLPNQINGVQLNEAITSLLIAIPEEVSSRSLAITGEIRRSLKARVTESEYGVEHVQTDVRTCGILVDDPASPGTFRFGHKSFMEFLFAEVVADQILGESAPDAASILNACDASARDISHFPVAVEFLSELLRSSLESATSQTYLDLAKRIFRLLHKDNYLDYVTSRMALYQIVLIDSTSSMRPFYRFLLRLIFQPFIPLLVPLTLILFAMVEIVKEKEAWLSDTLFPLVLGATLLFLLLVPFMEYNAKVMLRFIRLATGTQDSEVADRSASALTVWNRLCKSLGFPDQVLYQFACVAWFPWIRNKPFDYLLYKSTNADGGAKME